MSRAFLAVIEDDIEDAEFFCSALNQNYPDLNICMFKDGNEFFDYLSSNQPLPDIVVTDLRMPLISGFEVIQHLKENPLTREIPVVVLSTSGNPSDMQKASDLGALAYFVKPYTFAEYSAITDEILGNLDKVS